jgi:hypothetical protein
MSKLPPLPSIDFAGTWKSTRGSEMTLAVSGNDVTGRYVSAIGDAKGESSFPLRGFVSGDLISFTVNFGQHATLVSWAGQFAPDDHTMPALHTVFVAAVNIENQFEADRIWGGVRTGSDTYTKLS